MNFLTEVQDAAAEDAFWADTQVSAVERVIESRVNRDGRETVIVSRHEGAVKWLAARGIAGPVFAEVVADQVAGKVVVGNLPLHLAAVAHSVGIVEFPGLGRGRQGRDLSPAEMDEAGARIQWYAVSAI